MSELSDECIMLIRRNANHLFGVSPGFADDIPMCIAVIIRDLMINKGYPPPVEGEKFIPWVSRIIPDANPTGKTAL
jgi:hypothetical protein